MAMKLTILLLCLLFILAFLPRDQALSAHVTNSELNPAEANNLMFGASEGSLRPQECGGRCTTRCSKTSFKKPCMFFCQKCCARCLCVPPGTYGNKQVCPCYNNWKTKRGGPKCP